jgi:hypothetical protein
LRPVTFYFAIGRDYRKRDLDIALATGQRHFLVPAGSLAAQRLRGVPGMHVALDSEAYPPNNSNRISLVDYWDEVLAWRRGSDDWGTLDWFASYDTIGDPERTKRDERVLQRLIVRDAPDAPLMKVVGLGMPLAEAAATILAHPSPGDHRPSFGIGGLAIQRYSAVAESWYSQLIDMLEATKDRQLAGVRLHLFGIGKPAWIFRSTRGLITSFDSSGPGRMAGVGGWKGIASRYTPIYGVSAEKLQRSREARLYYHLCAYRRTVGLTWTCLDESCFTDDAIPPAGIQHALSLEYKVGKDSERDTAIEPSGSCAGSSARRHSEQGCHWDLSIPRIPVSAVVSVDMLNGATGSHAIAKRFK